jgi:hypothetical protein
VVQVYGAVGIVRDVGTSFDLIASRKRFVTRPGVEPQRELSCHGTRLPRQIAYKSATVTPAEDVPLVAARMSLAVPIPAHSKVACLHLASRKISDQHLVTTRFAA